MPNYLDDSQRAEVLHLNASFISRTEWPTWLLIVCFYAAWASLVLFGDRLGKGLSIALLLPLIVLWMSLQHESIHGHPTRWPWLNKALLYLPFAVWYPYQIYKDTHLAHHDNESLTLPGVDPESRYISAAAWKSAGHLKRLSLWADKTALGRLAIGAPLAVGLMLCLDVPQALRQGGASARVWGLHLVGLAMLLWLVNRYSAINAVEYIFYVSMPALSISMLRSFYEHKPSDQPEHRTVINESRGVLSWLFLNLNLHLVHHDLPGLPWYLLPVVYRTRRADWIARNNGYVVPSYRALVAEHWVRPIDCPVHPGPTAILPGLGIQQ